MATTIGELLVKLGLDGSTYTKGISDAESKTKGSTGNIGKSFDDAGGHVSKFGGIMAGIGAGIGMAAFGAVTTGIGKVTDVLGDAEKAYQDAAVSTAQLSTAVGNNVGTWSYYQAGVEKGIDANLKFGFSGDDLRSSMAILVGVTDDVGQAQKDQAEAMDLARLKGIDLASATNIVMKAQEGNTGALKKLGIAIAPVTTAMDKLNASGKKVTQAQKDAAKAADLQATETAALTGITQLAGGQAEAYADTSAGKLAAAHAKVTEAMVKLGGITDQIVQAVMPGLADAFENIMNAVGPVLTQLGTAMPGVIATVQAAIQALSGALSPIVKVFAADIPGAIDTVKAAISGLLPSFGSSGAGGAASGLGKDMTQLQTTFSAVFADIQSIVTAATGIITNIWKTFGSDIMGAVKVYMQYIQETFQNVLAIVQGVFDTFSALFKGDWAGVWKGIQEIFSGVWAQVGSIFRALLNALPIALDAFGKIIGGLWGNIWHGLQTAAQSIGNAINSAVAQYVIQPVKDGFNSLVTFIIGIPGRITSAASGMFDGIWNAFKGAINNVIRGWNSLHFSFAGFNMGPLGNVAGFNMSVPKIPTLHSGGIVPGAPGTDVLALLQAGERVTSRADVARGGGAGNTFYITNPVPEPPSVSMAHANLMLAYSGRSGN
jgi:phage-related protein